MNALGDMGPRPWDAQLQQVTSSKASPTLSNQTFLRQNKLTSYLIDASKGLQASLSGLDGPTSKISSQFDYATSAFKFTAWRLNDSEPLQQFRISKTSFAGYASVEYSLAAIAT